MRDRIVIAMVIILCAAAFTAVLNATADGAQSKRRNQPDEALADALKVLEDEARQAMRAQKIEPAAPDFASRFERALLDEDVIDAVARRVHDDLFIDAYSRWQLLSFEPALPTLNEQQFAKLLNHAPRMIENPRSETGIVEAFRNAEKIEKLSGADLNRLRNSAAELERRTRVAAEFNRPAESWRAWMQDQFCDRRNPTAESLMRELQFHIERCHATITAGWPSREVKAALTRTLKSATGNTAFDASRRAIIAESLRRLIGLRREAVNEITFNPDGSIDVSFTYPSVDEDDVNKWVALIEGARD